MKNKPGKTAANPHEPVAPEDAGQKRVSRNQPGYTGDA